MTRMPQPQGISEGLLALAQETRDADARAALKQLSQSVASGASLPQAIASLPTAPAHLASLLRAAGERGTYALSLAQIAAGEHRARRLGKTAVRGLVYPVLLLLACAALTLAFGTYVLGPLHELLNEFELRLPRYVGRMQFVTIWGSALILSIAGVGCVLALGVRLFGGQRGFGWFVTYLPLVGRNHHWASVIEWLELLRLLIIAGRPLPDALQEAGAAIPDAYVGQASHRVRQRVISGLPLWQAYSQEAALPASLWPFLRAGEEHASLPAAIENCETLLFGRLEMRVQMQDRWVPVLIICLSAMMITWIVMGVLSPMFGLIQGLSRAPGGGGGFGDPSYDTLLLAVLLIPGIAVLISRRVLIRRGVSMAGKQADPLLGTIGFLLVATGLTGLIIAVSGGIVVVPAIITLIVAGDAFIFTRRCQHRALLWSLAAAAKRNVPFPEVLRAVAEDESASVSPFALRFAEGLERGEPLDASARQASLWLPRELRVALAWAGRTGLVEDALEQSLTTERTAAREFQRIVNVCVYFWAVLLVMTGILTFIMLKIVPVFAKMFQEFELKLPAPTLLLIDISNTIVSGFFMIPLLGLVLFAIGALLLDVNIGLFAQHVPPFSYLMRRYWGAHLLQLLAPAIRRGFSLQDALATLAAAHPLAFVRNRIAAALGDYQQGQSVWLALAKQGLVGQREAAVLAAAERAGNLPWALEEMAESTLRKQVYWMRGWYNVVVPLGVLLLGVVVAYIVISLLMPLVALIQGLAPSMSGA